MDDILWLDELSDEFIDAMCTYLNTEVPLDGGQECCDAVAAWCNR